MRNTIAIMQRELLSLFFSPIAYIVIAGFLFFTGILVWQSDSFSPGKPATLRTVFQWTPIVLAFFIPAMTMRMISEEYRNGTFETLMTAPVSDLELVLGKYLAGAVFYLVMLATTLVYMVLLIAYGNPDLGAALAGYFGLLVVGLAFVAVGLLASSLSRNQVVAWIAGAVPLILVALLAYFISLNSEGWVRQLAQQVDVMNRFEMFNRGLIRLDGLVFFLGSAAFFVFCTVKVVESQRWR